jgi:hypothetical protein
MTFKKQWITALTISALTVGGASAYAATNDDSSTTTKQTKHGHHFEGMKKHDMTLLLKKLNLTQAEADAAREKGQSIADLAKAKGISSERPSSFPSSRTSSLNNVLIGSINLNCMSSGNPPTLWCDLIVCAVSVPLSMISV